MTNGELLLDTNLAIAFFRQDAGVQQALRGASRVLVPVIVIGELLAGALQGGQPEREQARIVALIALAEVIGCDLETARQYAQVRDELRRQGRPIPQNDTWIAALARQHSVTLASRDSHFDSVPGLRRVPCLN
jgi:tRNA(fMet)-specific endonuclease VapC